MRNEKGFTLIELVMVIVILGILTAVAVPKFIDLRAEAKDAALQGVVAGISSASAVNYAGRAVDATKGEKTADLTCSAAATVLLQGGIPDGYTLDATAGNVLVDGQAKTCTVTQTDGSATADATIIGIN
ncbi:MAG: type II secretion system protein [Deltaproteobacteria bacterium]|nr:type II secretion system protein [Deltaproteobacteria bacterium]